MRGVQRSEITSQVERNGVRLQDYNSSGEGWSEITTQEERIEITGKEERSGVR